MRGAVAVVVACALALLPAAARADDWDASVSGCVEMVPHGARRPVIVDTFPAKGTSGYAATLVVKVEHGKGETVLPRGLDLATAAEAAKVLKSAGFAIPHQDGGSGARLTPGAVDPAKGDRTTTTLEIPLVPLPDKPGRQMLTLPPLPIAVARASGEIASVCTQPHTIVVDDPIASTPDAQPKPNPDPRQQREEWTALERALTWIAIGLVIGAIVALFLRRWMRRPKPVPPPPPPRPPWEIALERIDEVRHAGLLEVGRHDEYFDRLNDAVRSYLGARYGFDGLESTTDEILGALEHAQLAGLSFSDVVGFLRECDLVKFARMTPTADECRAALDAGEHIVRMTMPQIPVPAPAFGAPPPTTIPPSAPPPPAPPGGMP